MADFYGIGVILLAITSLAITLFRGRRVWRLRQANPGWRHVLFGLE
jgi:hypothetical protein